MKKSNETLEAGIINFFRLPFHRHDYLANRSTWEARKPVFNSTSMKGRLIIRRKPFERFGLFQVVKFSKL